MSLPFRICFNGKDYSYIVLTKLIDRDTVEIKVSIEGEEFTIARDRNNSWRVLEASIKDDNALLESVARAVSLRYRI